MLKHSFTPVPPGRPLCSAALELPGLGSCLLPTSEKIRGYPKTKSKPKRALESTNPKNEPTKLLIINELSISGLILLEYNYLNQFSAPNWVARSGHPTKSKKIRGLAALCRQHIEFKCLNAYLADRMSTNGPAQWAENLHLGWRNLRLSVRLGSRVLRSPILEQTTSITRTATGRRVGPDSASFRGTSN